MSSFYKCEECYKQACEQVKDSNNKEQAGSLAYDFLHYEWNHGNKEKMGY